MKIRITTSEVNFELEDPNLKTVTIDSSHGNEGFLKFVKELIQKVSDESIKLKS